MNPVTPSVANAGLTGKEGMMDNMRFKDGETRGATG